MLERIKARGKAPRPRTVYGQVKIRVDGARWVARKLRFGLISPAPAQRIPFGLTEQGQGLDVLGTRGGRVAQKACGPGKSFF